MKFLTKHINKVIILSAVLLSIFALIIVLVSDTANANGDSIARLNLSRRVVDGTSPGFSQIGYVWLPASSFLMLPTIWIDWAYYSGMSGILVSMISYVMAAYFVYRVGESLGGRKLGVIAFLFFALNPNILYMQATPLSEIFYIAMLVGAIHYLLLWARLQKEKELVLSGIFFTLSSLSRYDGWILSLAAVGTIVIYLLLRRVRWSEIEATAILFSLLAFFGPVLWLLWNYTIFNDPFYFARGEYSAKFQQLSLLESNLLPSLHDLTNTFAHISVTSILVDGSMLVILGTLGAFYALWRGVYHREFRHFIVGILGLQIIYYVINLFLGNGVIFVPQLYPHYMHNIRYGITFVPFFALMSALILVRTRLKLLAPLILLLVILEYGIMFSTNNIITLNESLRGFAGASVHESRKDAGEWLESNYTEGQIFVDTFDNDSVVFYSHIPLNQWIMVSDPDLYGKALEDPSRVVDWVVIRDGDSLDERFLGGEWLKNSFNCRYVKDDIRVYQIKDDSSDDNTGLCADGLVKNNSHAEPRASL